MVIPTDESEERVRQRAVLSVERMIAGGGVPVTVAVPFRRVMLRCFPEFCATLQAERVAGTPFEVMSAATLALLSNVFLELMVTCFEVPELRQKSQQFAGVLNKVLLQEIASERMLDHALRAKYPDPLPGEGEAKI